MIGVAGRTANERPGAGARAIVLGFIAVLASCGGTAHLGDGAVDGAGGNDSRGPDVRRDGDAIETGGNGGGGGAAGAAGAAAGGGGGGGAAGAGEATAGTGGAAGTNGGAGGQATAGVGGSSCPGGTHACSGSCLSNDSPLSCGTSCVACSSPA